LKGLNKTREFKGLVAMLFNADCNELNKFFLQNPKKKLAQIHLVFSRKMQKKRTL